MLPFFTIILLLALYGLYTIFKLLLVYFGYQEYSRFRQQKRTASFLQKLKQD